MGQFFWRKGRFGNHYALIPPLKNVKQEFGVHFFLFGYREENVVVGMVPNGKAKRLIGYIQAKRIDLLHRQSLPSFSVLFSDLFLSHLRRWLKYGRWHLPGVRWERDLY